ncbi:sugar O-acetyltransferase [Streptomyces alkaliterrae]|uniref:Sugar O-acetyltransferase n=1 Tax=Streptomyces alkaliterrae TaxID=2213162 RepID=A0A5P0YY29_9ACTN|nr:sugar O-acetyltransferase [Streptomyces alkaliterrae]MBB1261351.1 sugar O-acetyltransferase [Streptomyces alkaliterrae]MQS05181.1 sugar O-acetyltransferase [Streptomyces alkaliterrae]
MASDQQLVPAGEPYRADNPAIAADLIRAECLAARFNATPADDPRARRAALEALLGEVGEDVEIRPPLYVDHGSRVSVGAHSFVNFGAVLLDMAPITIGAYAQFGPRVQLLTPSHPIDPGRRRESWQCAKPITIGENVWLGGGVIVCPGVTIGDNTVVGAGAVVTRPLPPNVVAVGNPARVLREIVPDD